MTDPLWISTLAGDTNEFRPDDFIELPTSTGCLFAAGRNNVAAILTPRDRKVEFVCFENGEVLTLVKSAMGYPAYYPLLAAEVQKPIRAVLMDLDGTSVHSEEFWIWIIERTTARLLGDKYFKLQGEDLPHVSGHSVSEHLQYCIGKYCPSGSLEDARRHYFEITHHEMAEVAQGRGRVDAFKPAPGLKEFLFELKSREIKIGLVTSGLYEKAWPEIKAAFQQLNMGDPREFYDAIISAGFPLRAGAAGTLGELEPKPHPWLYAETARVGLGIRFEDRAGVVGIEDSGAGVVSIRLAGFAAFGMEGGNLRESGIAPLSQAVYPDFETLLKQLS